MPKDPHGFGESAALPRIRFPHEVKHSHIPSHFPATLLKERLEGTLRRAERQPPTSANDTTPDAFADGAPKRKADGVSRCAKPWISSDKAT